jgi:hypothetical protein
MAGLFAFRRRRKYMTLPQRVHAAWARLCIDARGIWEWHRHQMDTNPHYARAFIEGVVRALWQDSIEKFLLVLFSVLAELLRILRRDGFNIGTAFHA